MKQGWKIKKLKEICAKITDGTHQTPKYFDEGVIFLSSKNVTSGKIDWDNIKYIDEKQHLEMHKRVAPRVGDILLAKNGTTGVAAMVDRDVVFDIYVSLAHIRVLEEVTPEFMLYFINSPIAKKQFNKRLKGSGVPNLHLEEIREVEILLPPLSEQQRIVAILDEVFEAIAKAKANAEQNLKNAKELFESYLQKVFETKGEGWEEKNFEDCFKLKSGDGLTSKNMSENGEYPVFGGNGIAGLHNNFNLSGSNIIIGRVGALCGNVRHITENIWLTDNAFKVVGLKFDYDHSFLTYLLNYKNLRSFARQAAQPVISNSSLKNVALEFPKSLKEQQNIAQKLDVLLLETKKLEAIYKQKINDLEELKKSVLQKAFAGELKENLKEHYAENA